MVLVGALVAGLTACSDEQVPAPDASLTPSTSISESPTASPSGSEPSPTSGGLDPEDFGGHPPAVLLDPLTGPWGGSMIPLPEEIGEYVLTPGGEFISEYSSSGAYEGPDGRQYNFVMTSSVGEYVRLMDRMSDHRQVGIAVCGRTTEDFVGCAAASEDADLTIRGMNRSSFTDEEFAGLLEDFTDWYLAQA
ncbi:MAG: hypothetical protein GX596_02570 [Propionibacterium sp.]|nr:hypothetical protein [Propionibacterium sp.]